MTMPASYGWEWPLLVLTQILALVLTLRDDGFEEREEKYLGAAAWPALCALALLRAGIVHRPFVHMAALAAIAVGSVLLATGLRPGLIVGSSVKRAGRSVTNLVVRQILGWFALVPAIALGLTYLVSVGELDFGG